MNPGSSPRQEVIENEAVGCRKCDGCKHQEVVGDSGWCYMFKKEPVRVPCGQHDMFKTERIAMGKLIRKNPLVLMSMIELAVSEEIR